MDLLAKKNIRATNFRKEVIDVFLNHECAITLSTIEQSIGKHDRITLYRTIKTFIEKGILHEVLIPNEEKKLALCQSSCSSEGHQHDHIHFKCESCEEVYCKEVDRIPQLTLAGFEIKNIEINASGICEKCV